MTPFSTRLRIAILLLLLTVAAACARGGGESVPASDEPASATGGAGGEAPSSGTSPPEIRLVAVTPAVLSEGESVTIVVAVDDPDGPDDILGGRLLDATGSIQLGLFERQSDGRFSYTVSWQQLDAYQEIAFEQVGARPLRVLFIDNQLHQASRDIQLTLECRGYPACQGHCASAAAPDLCSHCDDDALCCQAARSQVPANTLCSDQLNLFTTFKDCVCNQCASVCGKYCVPTNAWVTEACYSCLSTSCVQPLSACFWKQPGCG
ncbi:MAG TPA: hypothetical protein ENK23_00945 [Sorangium sp.]|nr:hypothetical protein [Sorangium sp.]